ncbi:MAG: DUF3108 domain-containing protein [Actinomycetota bacterium]
MDRGARDRIVRRVGKGASALLMALLLAAAGCHRYERGVPPPPPPGTEEGTGDNTAAAAPEWLHPAVPVDGKKGAEKTEETAATPAGGTARDNTAAGAAPAEAHRPPGAAEGGDASRVSAPPAAPAVVPTPGGEAGSVASLPRVSVGQPMPTPSADAGPGTHKPKPAAAPHPVPAAPPKDTRDASPPGWAKSPEELVYRVDFIGITMGYARFRYQGKVTIAGKPAYHLNVRAWTSGVLSYIYPINETIDYYLDVETIAPIRQEFTQRESEKDDVALYNQETGWITYRYRQSGKIRKRVETVPSVYDPVSVAYYFRWRDLGAENRPRNMYGGRKVYQISSRILGHERIRTEHGEVDTIAVLPVIRRDGKPDDKGDLKVWFSNDERRVPVRLYAKFHKIKDWTLVGELVTSNAMVGG